jgi:hypothetical protein
MGNNLTSPNSITTPCDLDDLSGWYDREVSAVEADSIRAILLLLGRHVDDVVRWAAKPVLLWDGCDRVVPLGSKTKYHRYPDAIRILAKQAAVYLDARANGPAIAAFQLAHGERPSRSGSSNAWSIHHLYSGKFPYPGHASTTHASKHCKHFSQSAGLVAVHPIADAVCDECPALTWLLRAQAFLRFGYDPDGVFTAEQDSFGFANGRTCDVLFGSAGGKI